MAKKGRFFKKVLDKSFLTVTELWIDRETGVNYLYYLDGTAGNAGGGGLTVFFGKDGKPVITPPEELAKLDQE